MVGITDMGDTAAEAAIAAVGVHATLPADRSAAGGGKVPRALNEGVPCLGAQHMRFYCGARDLRPAVLGAEAIGPLMFGRAT